MKRSHAIAVGATGLILAGAWLGSGKQSIDDASEPKADAAVFASVQDCVASNTIGRDACEAEFRLAEEKHVAAAPKFLTQSECEGQYGASGCKSTSFNGASVFIPAMVGLLVANHLSNRRQAQALYPAQTGAGQPCPPGHTPQTMPGCVAPRASGSSSSSSGGSSGGGWRSYSTASGHTVSRAATSNLVSVPASAAVAPPARTSVGAVAPRSSISSTSSVSRGGFGSSGRASSSSS